MADRILRAPQVVEKVGLSLSTIYGMVKRGLFPQQVVLGMRARGWRESEVDAWICARPGSMAASQAPASSSAAPAYQPSVVRGRR